MSDSSNVHDLCEKEIYEIADEKENLDDNSSNDLEDLKEKISLLNEKYIRAVAETENVRKRSIKEIEDAAKFGSSLLAKDVVVFVDNLERAVKCCPKIEISDEIKSFINGVGLIVDDVLKSLEKHGITKIESDNSFFNPELHQAVSNVELEDKGLSGKVVETLQTGYMLNGRLLRAALVVVAK